MKNEPMGSPPPRLHPLSCSWKSPPRKSLLSLSSDSFVPLLPLLVQQQKQQLESREVSTSHFHLEHQLHQRQDNHQQQQLIAVCLFEKEKTNETSHAQVILLDATGDTEENSWRANNPNPNPNQSSELAPSVQENNNNNNEDENENEYHETRKKNKFEINRPEVVSTPEEEGGEAEEVPSSPLAASFPPAGSTTLPSPRAPAVRFDFNAFLRQGHDRIGFVEERDKERERTRENGDEMTTATEENEKNGSIEPLDGNMKKNRKRKFLDDEEEQGHLFSSSPTVTTLESIAAVRENPMTLHSQQERPEGSKVKMENNSIEPRRSTRRRRISTKASSSWPFPPPRTRSAAAPLLTKKNDIGDYGDDDDKSLCSCSSQDFQFSTVKSTYPTTRMIFEEEDDRIESRKQQPHPQPACSRQSAFYQTTGSSSSVVITERIATRIGSRYQADIPPFLGKKSLDSSSSSSAQLFLLENRVWIPSLLPDDLGDSITGFLKGQNNAFWKRFIGDVFPVPMEDSGEVVLCHSPSLKTITTTKNATTTTTTTKRGRRFCILSNVYNCWRETVNSGPGGVCGFVGVRAMSFSEVGGKEV
jgi:hypothetical protein